MCKKEKNAALIVAAGSGSRMKSGNDANGIPINKVFLPLDNMPVLARTLSTFQNCDFIDTIAVVTRKYDVNRVWQINEQYNVSKLTVVCEGGESRMESVKYGLRALNDIDYVFIHDGARCLVSKETVEKCFADAKTFGAAAPGVGVKDSIKSIDNGFIKGDIDRRYVVNIQTPQVFKHSEILKCHEEAAKINFNATDDTSVYMHFGGNVRITDGEYENIKITTPEDIELAKQILGRKEIEK